MKCILQFININYKNNIKLIGSLIDSLEYFIESYKYNKNITLFLISNIIKNEKYLRYQIDELINQRYNNISKNIIDNIIFMNIKNFIKYNMLNKFKLVVCFDLGIPNLIKKNFIYTDKLIIVSELTYEEFFVNKSNKYVVEYYGEMPFVYKDYQYNMKFLFNDYKKINNFKNNYYIVCNTQNKSLNLYKDKLDKYNPKFIKKYDEPIFNIHVEFDKLVYIQTNEWFDTHPRLMHESYFYNKEIIFESNGRKDGGYYRYKDLLKNGLNNRILSKNDEIIKILC